MIRVQKKSTDNYSQAKGKQAVVFCEINYHAIICTLIDTHEGYVELY